ncbi:hypothetical protein K461DRAFT_230117 [Myriangium duriaei CBS 260.36]|uniref:Allergen n=1 Tax=Myriangium duriaei CBS 260.36 TaxID=1168546 RepID=A0A9P4ME12_9PEZI|nr:hypothetical protein K461DRAFT_230117 [Myriangium duriaei CBS 260.36]
MNAAKNAVKDFMHQDGKHTTNVHETMAPAVANETQHTHHHVNEQTAIDREIHQDHHHTTVQPIHDRKVLDEQHHHKLGGVEHRKFEHGNDEDVRRRLDEESAKYVDTHQKGETRHTTSAAPTVTGEHVHHHVHERVQPVIDRQVIEPHVTHTVVPIKEQHHNAAAHHSATTLPAVSLEQFKKQGGALGGREERSDFFEGEPRHMGRHNGATGTGVTGSGASGLTGATTGTHQHGTHHHGTTGTGVTGSSTTGSGLTGSNTTGSGLTDTTTKPSLLSRLNPLKDSDGDGKKGIMD